MRLPFLFDRLKSPSASGGSAPEALFLEELALEVQRSRRYERPLSLLICRVGGLDAFGGHREEALRQVETVLKQNVRAIDVIVRAAGDELFLFLPETGERSAS